MTMSAKLKKLALALAIILLLSSTLANVKLTFASDTDGRIDLYTQKEPYNGKGLHMPSDAFGPGELVILYTLVTHNEFPLQNLIVTFYVEPPDNSSFYLTARTNASGIATANFAVPQKCDNESVIFGEWLVLANVLIDDNTFQDTLTFKVDWIVKLISVRTIDENLTYRGSFGIGGDVGLEITLRSIAMITINATLAVVIQDELNVPVNSSVISDFKVQSNEKLIFLYLKLYLPKWSHVGLAKVFVSALTALASEGGVPYCPAVSTDFFIMPFNPLTIVFYDVAVVNVVPSATYVALGESLSVGAVVRNEGTEVESFNVNAYCGSVLIGTLEVTALLPYSEANLNFVLDTSSFDTGNYTIVVSIPYLINEADHTDNDFVDGVIEIKPKLPTIIHDIAILNVNVSTSSLYIGELLQINVSIINKGTETERFDIGAYYDFSLIGTIRVENLAPGAQVILTFIWNTTFVSEGFYQIRASAPLPGDIDLSDNTFVDGVVYVEAKPPIMIHDIAVLDVTPSSTLVYIGGTVNVEVAVRNYGNYTESFNVTLFYNLSVVDIFSVNNLEIGAERKLVIQWNTRDVLEGNYVLSASASIVPGEVNFENNRYYDGVVKVVAAPKGWFVPDWLYWFLLFLLLLIIILLIAWLYRRRRKKKAEETFNKGWAAWYYCYDLRGKVRKI
jgi:hypothetical protein